MWNLYKIKPYKDYPSTTYFWVDENNVVQFQRSIAPVGYVKVEAENCIGFNIKETIAKKCKTKMTQEELKKGWLFL
jgi:hypothetical protein